MSTVKRFEDLDVWKLSRQMVNEVYSLTNKGGFSKDYGLKDQIRRSGVSVMNNISEGFESRTVNGFINYLGLAKGSCGETRSMLYVALDQKYINKDEFKSLYELCSNISSKLYRFMKYLESYDSNDRVKEVRIDYKA